MGEWGQAGALQVAKAVQGLLPEGVAASRPEGQKLLSLLRGWNRDPNGIPDLDSRRFLETSLLFPSVRLVFPLRCPLGGGELPHLDQEWGLKYRIR